MALTLISTHTASASATLDITSGIDSTYDSYEFHFVNLHPATDGVRFQFQVNAVGQTGFNEVMTTTYVRALNRENDTFAALAYETTYDQAQGTSYQYFSEDVGGGADESVSGILTLYAPSSTTYVKHFTLRSIGYWYADGANEGHVAGYINTTAAIDEISFSTTSGNIDDGTIKMFGVS